VLLPSPYYEAVRSGPLAISTSFLLATLIS
jgi:hypothetical protein